MAFQCTKYCILILFIFQIALKGQNYCSSSNIWRILVCDKPHPLCFPASAKQLVSTLFIWHFFIALESLSCLPGDLRQTRSPKCAPVQRGKMNPGVHWFIAPSPSSMSDPLLLFRVPGCPQASLCLWVTLVPLWLSLFLFK